jgi:hypothetical protein
VIVVKIIAYGGGAAVLLLAVWAGKKGIDWLFGLRPPY